MMNNKKFRQRSAMAAILTIVVSSAGFSGCASGDAVREIETSPRRIDPTIERHLDFAGHAELSKKIVVDQVIRRESSVPLLVQIDLMNVTDGIVEFYHKSRWFDPDGIEVSNPVESWRWAKIRGRERLSLKILAPNTTARDWRIVFKK